MKAQRWQSGSVLAVLGGVLVTAVFVALALQKIDTKAIVATWHAAELFPWLPLAVSSYLVGHIVRGARCRLLFGPQSQLRLGTASNIVVVGYACNNILPLRLGEFVRAGMLSERTGAPFVQSFTVIFVERLLDGVAILALLLGVSLWVPTEGWLSTVIVTAMWIFGVAVLGLVAAVTMPTLLVSLTARLTSVHAGLQSAAVRLVMRITNAVLVLRDPVVVLKTLALSLVVWMFEAGLFAFLLPAFGVGTPLRLGVLAMSMTNLGIMVPSTPGFVGPFHFFCKEALLSQGIAAEIGLSVAVAVHLAFYIPATLWGAAALLWYGVELGSTLALARRARHASQVTTLEGVSVYRMEELPPRRPPHLPESRLLRSISEALITSEGAPSGAGAAGAGGMAMHRYAPDPERVQKAAEFLEDELRALPSLLAWAVTLGLTGFRALVFVRYMRPFCSLSLERRRRIVSAWAWGGFGLTRLFFRPFRSIALMAYYETLMPKAGRGGPISLRPRSEVGRG